MKVIVYSTRTWGNQVKRRYRVTLTDLQGHDHVDIIGVFKVDELDDGTLQANALLSSKKKTEIEQYKDAIKSGINPFLKQSRWNTRVELLIPILTDALSNPATDAIVYNGLPYLALVTDDELIALFNKNQLWVDALRLSANNLLSGKTLLDAYTPILEV